MPSRREFLALALGLALAPTRVIRAAAEERRGTFAADVGLLYGALGFKATGTIEETIDRAAGRYAVAIRGEGSGVSHTMDSSGILREGRWAPLRTSSLFVVYGRESRLDSAFDYERRMVEYHSRSETFFLRRRRIADDVLAMPEGLRLDDVITAALNYADGQWPPEPDA